ncbi:MAG TPA: hypothetical protein VFP53_01430 [Sphingomicrobium sp.]|nr:hypothetical protein [Sphingomicrobium sp.]
MPDIAYGDPSERLPWLSNEPPAAKAAQERTALNLRELAGWAVAGVLIVAGASYWLGTQSGPADESARPRAPATTTPDATLKLPAPEGAAQPQVAIPEMSDVAQEEAPEVAMPSANGRQVRPSRRPRLKREAPSTAALDDAVDTQTASKATPSKGVAKPAARAPAPLASRSELKLWPSRQVKGANGRLVQIGAFGSSHQAKLGWRHMQRAYPAIGRLPAVVVEARNSRGRKFYRFQIGTTSQAHSEVLCQRMAKIHYSCAVLGLPWKAKVER